MVPCNKYNLMCQFPFERSSSPNLSALSRIEHILDVIQMPLFLGNFCIVNICRIHEVKPNSYLFINIMLTSYLDNYTAASLYIQYTVLHFKYHFILFTPSSLSLILSWSVRFWLCSVLKYSQSLTITYPSLICSTYPEESCPNHSKKFNKINTIFLR